MTEHPRWAVRVLLCVATVSAAFTHAGCFHYRPARSAAPASAPVVDGTFDDRSQAEDRERLRTLAGEIAPGRLAALEPAERSTPLPEVLERRLDAAVDRRGLDVLSVDLSEMGLLVRHEARFAVELWGEEIEAVGDDPRVRYDTLADELITVAPNARYLSAGLLARLDAEAAAIEAARVEFEEPRVEPPAAGLRWTSSRVAFERLTDGVDMTLPGDVGDDAAGVVVYLPAMFPNVYEYRVIEELLRRGWEMVFIDASPSVDGPNAAEIEAARERQRLEFRRRMTPAQNADLDGVDTTSKWADVRSIYDDVARRFPTPPTGFEWSEGVDEAALGAAIGDAVDSELLDYVMAARAALHDVFNREPTLADKPVVVVGFSGGSLVAPAVALGLRESVVNEPMALVLVGGGGDVLSVALDSSLTRGGLDVVPRGEALPGDVRERLVAAYREQSRLDPLRVIASLRDVPLLKVYADSDDMVPTDAAKALVAAHGGADRLVFDGDHMPLFFFLPRQKSRIADWVERSFRQSVVVGR